MIDMFAHECQRCPRRWRGRCLVLHIMSSAKTTCDRCGTEILRMTASLTGGHCMPCAKAMARANEPVPDYVRRRNRNRC